MNDADTGTGIRHRIVVGVDDLAWRPGRVAVGSPPGQAIWFAICRCPVMGTGVAQARGPRRQRRKHGLPVVLSFAGDEQRDESAKLVRQAFRSAVGRIPRDVALTIEIPEGDPGPVLTNIAAADGDLLVVGRNSGRA
jgi:hypothetical protein